MLIRVIPYEVSEYKVDSWLGSTLMNRTFHSSTLGLVLGRGHLLSNGLNQLLKGGIGGYALEM